MTHPTTDIPIIILAAGQSSRMRGIDKLMQIVSGVPLIRRQVDMALSVTTGPVIVALPVFPHPRQQALQGTDAVLIEVPDAQEGMNASLRAAMRFVPGTARAAMVLLGDLPELTKEDLNKVSHSFESKKDFLIWRGATADGKPGHPVIFSAQLFDQIARLKGDSGGREVVQAAAGRIALVPLVGNRARLDLDTPEDWAEWRTRTKPDD